MMTIDHRCLRKRARRFSLQPEAIPNLGAEIGNEFNGADLGFHPEQFPPHSFFDFDAFDTDQTGRLPHEASEQTSRVQPNHGASLIDCD